MKSAPNSLDCVAFPKGCASLLEEEEKAEAIARFRAVHAAAIQKMMIQAELDMKIISSKPGGGAQELANAAVSHADTLLTALGMKVPKPLPP